MARVFFYGLYMDAALLMSMGHSPNVVGPAKLDGYRLMIGARATLVPEDQMACFGLLVEMEREDLAALYSRPEVEGYAPVAVTVELLIDGKAYDAECYVLVSQEAEATPNTAYAKKLAALASRLGLPDAYVREIERLCDG